MNEKEKLEREWEDAHPKHRSRVITYTSNPDTTGYTIGLKPKSEPKTQTQSQTHEAIHPMIPNKTRFQIQRIIDDKYNGDYQAAYEEIQALIREKHPRLAHPRKSQLESDK